MIISFGLPIGPTVGRDLLWDVLSLPRHPLLMLTVMLATGLALTAAWGAVRYSRRRFAWRRAPNS